MRVSELSRGNERREKSHLGSSLISSLSSKNKSAFSRVTTHLVDVTALTESKIKQYNNIIIHSTHKLKGLKRAIIIVSSTMKFAGLTLAAVASTAAAIHSSRAPLFGVTRSTNFQGDALVTGSHGGVSAPSFLSVSRGGASLESDDSTNEDTEAVELYLPGLLEATVAGKWETTDASTDYSITISPSKARELGVKSGEVVGIIGRRRRASYAVVTVAKGSKGAVKLSFNLASNLRVRGTDKVKVVPLEEDSTEANSGDMALLTSQPSVAHSVTFSPVKDSLHSLELSEGGDEIAEDELIERFVKPYLDVDGSAVLKQGHTITLRDDNNKALEFTVTHLDIEGDAEDEDEVDEIEDEGKNYHVTNCNFLYFFLT